MKKSILILSVLAVSIVMTSCLGDVDPSYTDDTIVYIDMDTNGTIYGKTIPNNQYIYSRFITSPEIQMLYPGEFKRMAYSWQKEDGTTPIDINFKADNVTLSGDIEDVDKTSLYLSSSPEVEEPEKFITEIRPIIGGSYLDDFWLFDNFIYEATKEQTATVYFYWNEEKSNIETGIAHIDIHLEVNGEPQGSVSSKTGVIALDMSPLRGMYGGGTKDEIVVQFTYYRKDRNGPVESPLYRMDVAVN